MDAQTEAYRREVTAVTAAATVYAVQQLQLMFDVRNVMPSFETWLDAITGTFDAAANQAIALARIDYFETRRTEVAGGVDPIWRPQPLSVEAMRTSMFATAGQSLQGIERFRSDPERYPMVSPGAALKRAKIQAAGVATRQVMNAARNSTIATARGDRRALGALYVTRSDEKVCYWCAMLASRGPVYGKDSWAVANARTDRNWVGSGTAKSHDHCRCVLKTVYSDGSPLLDESHRLEELWRDTNWDPNWRDMDPRVPHIRNSGKKALAEWRKVWEGRA